MMRWMLNLKKLFFRESVVSADDSQTRLVKRLPPESAIKEALDHPNGWVYEIDAAFEKNNSVPPIAIKGAWKVNDKGIIEGEFVPNPNYVGLSRDV